MRASSIARGASARLRHAAEGRTHTSTEKHSDTL